MKLVTLVLGLASCAFAAANTAPKVYDVTSLLSNAQEVSLLGGKKVQIEQRWSADKILFEDKMPGANWEHPAVFKVVDRAGKVVEEIAVTRPPLSLENAPVVSGGTATNSPDIKYAIDDLGGKHKVADASKFYAILINGRADLRHWNDFSFLYRVLTQIYGYKKENIIVVDGVYKERQPDLDGDGTKDIQYSSTKEGLTKAMEELKGKLTSQDHLVLAVNDHGGSTAGESTIILMDGEMKVSDFSKLFKELKAGSVLSLYEQCYSGGFVRPSTAYNRVSMAAATDREFSWASKDLNWDEWIYHVIVAFAQQTHDGKKVETDTNRDGRVSAQEAFAYSVAADRANESPLMESHSNAGNARHIGLGFNR